MSEWSPKILLTKQNRERFLNNVKEMPSLNWLDTSPTVFAAVLIPLCIVDGDLCLLYTLRSSNLNSHSGQVSFPGGKRDEGENFQETALRETEEELGLSRDNIEIWTEMMPVQSGNRVMSITPVVGFINNFESISLTPNINEVEEVFTVSLKHLCNPKTHGYMKFGNIRLTVYEVNSKRIWGLTAMMTHMFLLHFLPNTLYEAGLFKKKYEIDELIKSKI